MKKVGKRKTMMDLAKDSQWDDIPYYIPLKTSRGLNMVKILFKEKFDDDEEIVEDKILLNKQIEIDSEPKENIPYTRLDQVD